VGGVLAHIRRFKERYSVETMLSIRLKEGGARVPPLLIARQEKERSFGKSLLTLRIGSSCMA
jgi:hypothetical protein